MSDKKSESRNVGNNVHANDHMTVKHIQTELAVSKTQSRPQDYSIKQMTTAHISEALPARGKPQASEGKPQSVPSFPTPKSEK
jgi:hypothetical protein